MSLHLNVFKKILIEKKCLTTIIFILLSQFGFHIDQLGYEQFHAFCFSCCCGFVCNKSKVRETAICNERCTVILLDGRPDNMKKKRENVRERERQQ